MPLATDGGGYAEVGVLVRLNPWTGYYTKFPGLSVIRVAGMTKPLVTDFADISANGATYADKVDRLQISLMTNPGKLGALIKPLIAPPYTIDFAGGWSTIPAVSDTCGIGIALSDGTAVKEYRAGLNLGTPRLIVQAWTNTSLASGAATQQSLTISLPLMFLRITDDGTTRSYMTSFNGKEYIMWTTEPTNTFVTPTSVGITAYFGSSSPGNLVLAGWVHDLTVTPGILGDAF